LRRFLHLGTYTLTIMSQPVSKSTASCLPSPSLSGGNNSQGASDPLQSPRSSRRVLDNPPDFTYDLGEQSRDPLDSWPEQVEINPRRRSTLLSSLIRGNQPHRSFFGDKGNDDDSEPTAIAEGNQASNPFGNARKLSLTAMSALKEKVPLPWRQKRSPSQSANSRARTHAFPLLLLSFSSHKRSVGPPEEIHSPARQSVPHLRRTIPPRREAALRGFGQATHPGLFRVHTRYHHGLLQRRRDTHDGAALCALQRAHRALGPQQHPRYLPRRF
jgi:hypothetical protein